MRILYFHQYFNTPEMSGGTRSFEMARRLVAKGHEVHMITSWRFQDNRRDWFFTDEAGIKVHWLPVPYSNHMGYVRRIKSFLHFAFKSAVKAYSLKADLVFATSTPLTIALPAIYVSKRQRIPMVFEVRDLWPELPIAMGVLRNPLMRFAAYALEKWAYRNSEAVIALSPGMRDGVCKTGYQEERVAVIPNSSDNEFFETDKNYGRQFRLKREWLGDRPLLVYTGTFGPINGVDYLVSVAKELLKLSPEVRILLVGDGREFSTVKTLAEDCGVLGENLFIEKEMPKSDMPALLSAADMACALFIDKPEMRSNSANKFFDALAAGKPVMINYGGWMADLINNNDCGVVTWGDTAVEAARKIARALQNKSWLKEAGVNAKFLATTQFDRDVLAEQLESVLQSALTKTALSPKEITSKYYV
jgi:glycosyltransferase involved in cell wall biosynthesis